MDSIFGLYFIEYHYFALSIILQEQSQILKTNCMLNLNKFRSTPEQPIFGLKVSLDRAYQGLKLCIQGQLPKCWLLMSLKNSCLTFIKYISNVKTTFSVFYRFSRALNSKSSIILSFLCSFSKYLIFLYPKLFFI